MDDKLAKNVPRVQADNQSIAIGEINITGTVTGNITIGHTIVQPADGIVTTLGNPLAIVGSGGQEDSGEGERRNKINYIYIEGWLDE